MPSEDLFLSQLISDELNMIIMIIDSRNTVLFANASAKNLFEGFDATDSSQQVQRIFGMDVYDYIAQQPFQLQWQGTLFAKTSANKTIVLQTKAKYVPSIEEELKNLLMIAVVATPQLKKEVCANRAWNVEQEQFRNLCEISSTINSNLDYQSICAEITMKSAKLIGADKALLYSVNSAEIDVLAAWNMTEFQQDMFRLIDIENAIIKNCLSNMVPVLVPHYSKHPDCIPDFYEHLEIESFILYPLLSQKQLVGVLALLGKEPMQFGEQDLMLLQMISNQMAIAAQNAQVYSEIRNVNKHLAEEVCLKMKALKISEGQLIRKHAELEAVFHAIADTLVVVDAHLRILDTNKAAERYYNKDKQQVVGRYYCEVLCEQQNCMQPSRKLQGCSDKACIDCSHSCLSCYLKDSLSSGIPVVTEVSVGSRVFMISVYPILDEHSQVEKVVCCTRDITLTKRKSEELTQAQKMQAVGHLAAGVAHEIRNPLGAISNYVYVLEDWFRDIEAADAGIDKDIKNAIISIKQLVDRSESVIKNLLDFSRAKPNDVRIFNISDVLDQIIMLVGKTAQHNKVKIVRKGNAEFLMRNDSNAVQHILFNLIINSIDALPNGGEVVVEYELLPGKAALRVTDNGIGILKEDIDKVFNPFYTTKAPDRGTGLGLYVVYNLVEQLNGTISVVSNPGVQTTFTVQIPCEGAIA